MSASKPWLWLRSVFKHGSLTWPKCCFQSLWHSFSLPLTHPTLQPFSRLESSHDMNVGLCLIPTISTTWRESGIRPSPLTYKHVYMSHVSNFQNTPVCSGWVVLMVSKLTFYESSEQSALLTFILRQNRQWTSHRLSQSSHRQVAEV